MLIESHTKQQTIELVTIISIGPLGTIEGEFFSKKDSEELPKSRFIVKFNESTATSVGDKVLARIRTTQDMETGLPILLGEVIRKLKLEQKKIIGIFKDTSYEKLLLPINKKDKREYNVVKNNIAALNGELVEAKIENHKTKISERNVTLIRRLGDPKKTKLASMIAINEHEIPDEFPEKVILDAKKVARQKITNPTDLTNLPFISIDPADAKDHDDAIYASEDENSSGYFTVWIAIADVAKYVEAGSELDTEAFNRGNSTYFPDLVVPMIPDILSGNVCSLKQNESRASLAVKILINNKGQKISHEFFRGIIKNKLSVSYEEAQDTLENFDDCLAASELNTLMQPLYKVYKLLDRQRKLRRPLELELQERQISFDEGGEVKSINIKKRLETHKIVEEFMILANVCAAETIQKSQLSFLYRTHEPPTLEKLLSLKQLAKSMDVNLNTGANIQSGDLNNLLEKAKQNDCVELVSMTILRAMSQAHYTPKNCGHFGLSLANYTHFTSPIRRYSDLLIHRALIYIHDWDNTKAHVLDESEFLRIGEHLSRMERRSMVAERDTNDRYLAGFLQNKLGSEFDAYVNGLTRSGIFVRLKDTGADGLIPISSLSNDRFYLNSENNKLIGKTSKMVISIGGNVRVKLREANPVSGGLIFNLTEYEDSPVGQASSTRRRSKKQKSRRKNLS